MAEESTDEFLTKVATERKPLSALEKREAMQVAWKVRDIAKGKIPESKEAVILKNDEKQDTRYTVYVDRLKVGANKPPWAPQDSDLSIRVAIIVRNVEGGLVPESFDSYYISSSDVVKETAIFPQHSKRAEEADFIENPLLREIAARKQARLSKEQTTTEVFHPNKADLQSLLSIVSSAKEPPPVKIVPWPK